MAYQGWTCVLASMLACLHSCMYKRAVWCEGLQLLVLSQHSRRARGLEEHGEIHISQPTCFLRFLGSLIAVSQLSLLQKKTKTKTKLLASMRRALGSGVGLLSQYQAAAAAAAEPAAMMKLSAAQGSGSSSSSSNSGECIHACTRAQTCALQFLLSLPCTPIGACVWSVTLLIWVATAPSHARVGLTRTQSAQEGLHSEHDCACIHALHLPMIQAVVHIDLHQAVCVACHAQQRSHTLILLARTHAHTGFHLSSLSWTPPHLGLHTSSSSSSTESEQQQQQRMRSSGLLASGVLGSSGLPHAAAMMGAAPRAGMSSLSAAAAASASRGQLLKQQGLGLGLPAHNRRASPLSLLPSLSSPSLLSSPSSTQLRSYGDTGQHMGNAFLIATDIMFWSGLIGAVVFRRNLIVMLLTTEIVMLACNLNFLFGAAYMNDIVVSGVCECVERGSTGRDASMCSSLY